MSETTKVMVEIREGQRAYTYEVEGPVAVGDAVEVEFGNDPPRKLKAKVVALGAQPSTLRDGRIAPAYEGPCKRAVVLPPEPVEVTE